MMQTSQRSLLPVTAEEGGVRTRAFFGRVSDGAREAFSQRKPWAEMMDRNSFSKPASVSEAGARISNNLSYFRVNYLILVAVGVCVSFLTQPVSLMVLLSLLGAWIFLYLLRSEPLTLFGRSFGDREVLGVMLFLSVVVVFLTDVGSLLIWSLMVGAAGIAAHAVLRAGQADDLFMDQPQAPAQAGFLSFLGTPATAAPTSHV